MIKPAYSVSFLFSINIFVWQNVLYFLDAPRICGFVSFLKCDNDCDLHKLIYIHTFGSLKKLFM